MRSDAPGVAVPPVADATAAESELETARTRLKDLARRDRARQREMTAVRRKLREFSQDLEFALALERRRASELEQAYYDMVLRLTRASVYKDNETGGHIQRVSFYARILARSLGWSEVDQELIFRAAPMHDVGKIAIPDALIRKRGRLGAEERRIMESHTLIGAQLLEGSNSRLLEMARDIAITHHEHWDGTGYPRGLAGNQIPIAGRIVMLGDNYDALRLQAGLHPRKGLPHYSRRRRTNPPGTLRPPAAGDLPYHPSGVQRHFRTVSADRAAESIRSSAVRPRAG
jgi:putative nucleotidyltransferase with HDIG domain